VRAGRRTALATAFTLALLALPQQSAPTVTASAAKRSTSTAPLPPAPRRKLNPAAERWVASTLHKMSVDEKIGQVMCVTYFGGLVSTKSKPYQELLRQVEGMHVGGFIVITEGSPLGTVRSRVYPTAVLANQLQHHARIPLLIGADFETGTAMRLADGTAFPDPMAVAAGGSPKDAYEIGRITALEARAVGVNWVFAPVSDVNNNPDNPIINIRSFGEDPARVAEFVSAFVRGAEENGVIATAKHFPGHGNVSTDSHIDLPIVGSDRHQLENIELVPFRAAIAAGVSSIMTAHLAVPAIEPDTEVPATLSSHILTDLLRKQLHFEGLTVTDALDMGGVARRYPPGEAAVRALLAGADVLLMPPVPDAAFAAVKEAVDSGRIPQSRLDEAVTRILRAKAALGLHRERIVSIDALNSRFGRPEWKETALDIADRGVTLVRDAAHRLPLDSTRPARYLLAIISGDSDPYPGELLEEEIRPRVDTLEVIRTDTRFVKVSSLSVPAPESYDVAIIALFVHVRDRKGTIGLPDEQAALVKQLLQSGKPAAIVCFGNPYLIARFPSAPTWLAVFSTSDVAQQAAGRALFGQVAIAGHQPVSVPDATGQTLRIGAGISVPANPMKLRPAGPAEDARLKPVWTLLEKAVADRTISGGVVAVGHGDSLAVHASGHAAGKDSSASHSAALQPSTVFDASALEMPVIVSSLVGQLTERTSGARLDIDTPIESWLPGWAKGPNPEWRRNVTLRHLLTQTSGLQAAPADMLAGNRHANLARIFSTPLTTEPGKQVQDSALNTILAGEIVERATGTSLEAAAREQLFAPLSMTASILGPSPAKTSFQGTARNANRPSAVRSSGFSATAGDLSAFCRMLLNSGVYEHRRVLRASTIIEFSSPQPFGDGSRALGWEVQPAPAAAASSSGLHDFGFASSVGALLWLNPENDSFIVFLSNGAAPGSPRILEFEQSLRSAVATALSTASAAQASAALLTQKQAQPNIRHQ
jgi:beta-N-acetylhexosaminidase